MKFIKSIKRSFTYYNMFCGWFKRVFLHDKKATLIHQEKKLDKQFNQYYKLFKAFENYNIITLKEASESRENIKEQHLDEHNELVKIFGQKTCKKINSKKNKNYYNKK